MTAVRPECAARPSGSFEVIDDLQIARKAVAMDGVEQQDVPAAAKSCSDIGRDHLREAEVTERRTDEDGTWNSPGNAAGLVVQITRRNG